MKILIAEDDDSSREFLEEAVRIMGHDPVSAPDGVAALELFQRESPDITITDVQMPRMDGLELLRKIRELDPGAIVVVVTAFGSENYAIEALRAHASDYIRKPIMLPEFSRILSRHQLVAKDTKLDGELMRSIASRRLEIEIPNRIELISRLSQMLAREASIFLGQAVLPSIRLGLEEMLMNALEHGNLDIDYEAKSRALDESTGSILELIAEKMKDPALAARRIRVLGNLSRDVCEWVIADEGMGFDWKSLPDPTVGDFLAATHGRGIFLTRFQFDEVEYLGNGNTVRLLKRREKSTS